MSFASLSTPSRCALFMWAAGICATIALLLAVATNGSRTRDGRPPQEAKHGWVRGLFANNELRHSGR
jgi:hypothetical protein